MAVGSVQPFPHDGGRKTYDQCVEDVYWGVFFCSPWLYRGHRPVRSRLSRRDAEIALFRSCLHFGRQGKPAALFQMSVVTADSREWPFSFCTPWQMVKFLGAGLRQPCTAKIQTPRVS